MRATQVVVWTAVVLSTCTLWAGDEFPYDAYIRGEDVYVRSGPGRNYYPTDKLPKGTRVEVWRHDPGGWYAIRPPKDSFSWVSARYLRPLEDGVAVVDSDQVVARVGSKFSRVRDVIQVRLEKGEKVLILDESNTGGQTWYKIAAPSGEFRWVSGSYVDDEPVYDGLSKSRRGRRSEVADEEYEEQYDERYADEDVELHDGDQYDQYEQYDEQPEIAVRRRSARRPAGSVRLADYEEEAEDDDGYIVDRRDADVRRDADEDEPAVFIADGLARRVPRNRKVRDENQWRLASYDEPEPGVSAKRSKSRPSVRPGRSAPKSRRAPLDFDRELDNIEFELSAMVAEEPTVWTFAHIEDRLSALIKRADTAVERGMVRRIQHKLARFEDIRARYEQINIVQSDTDRANWRLESAAPRPRSSERDNLLLSGGDRAVIDQRDRPAGSASYDGQGILRPVVSRRRDAPRYALVDQTGEVLSFVTPAPGINLQPYLGQRVGMVGSRGYMPELKKPHVMANRISVLDTLQR